MKQEHICISVPLGHHNDAISWNHHSYVYSIPTYIKVMFLNLLFNSIRKDASLPRVRGFVKRMLQCCEHLPSHTTVGVLFIVSEIIRHAMHIES